MFQKGHVASIITADFTGNTFISHCKLDYFGTVWHLSVANVCSHPGL